MQEYSELKVVEK